MAGLRLDAVYFGGIKTGRGEAPGHCTWRRGRLPRLFGPLTAATEEFIFLFMATDSRRAVLGPAVGMRFDCVECDDVGSGVVRYRGVTVRYRPRNAGGGAKC